jgi:hypothetical protein
MTSPGTAMTSSSACEGFGRQLLDHVVIDANDCLID